MQSRNMDVNSSNTSASSGSNNTTGFTKSKRSAFHYQNSDDYVDLVLRNEIDQWFKKNSPKENESSTIEPTKSERAEKTSSVISLGFSDD